MASAFYGARLVQALSGRYLIPIIGGLLAALGCLLLAEAAFTFGSIDILPSDPVFLFAVGCALGLGIGRAGLGGLMVVAAPTVAPKLLLGCVLIAAAGKTLFARH